MTARRLAPCMLVAALFGLVACAGPAPRARIDIPPTARTEGEHILYATTTWSGDVRLVRPLIITRTATLTLRPGTRLFFDLPAPAADKDREPWILVLGSLVAIGSPEQPVVFSSTDLRQNELDDMIQVQEGKEAHFRHCVFERGPWALHVHETPVDVTNCLFRQNYGGLRFQGDKVTVRGSRFEDNRIGLRSLRAAPVIEENTFTGNLTGIFFREGVAGAQIRRNNFDNVEYDIKLGEGQVADVEAPENWWKAAASGKLPDRIYDGADAQGVGRVRTEGPLAAPWGTEAKK